jgi:DNA-binding MarR family transcriptional regulator
MLRPGEFEPELDELLEAVDALHRRLHVAGGELHSGGDATSARREVLQRVERTGDLTVPEIARARGSSRQHVQTLVDSLAADGLVALVDNPAHRRSRLVRITERGRGRLRIMQRREAAALAALATGIDPWRLREATQVLAGLRTALESRRWQEIVGED